MGAALARTVTDRVDSGAAGSSTKLRLDAAKPLWVTQRNSINPAIRIERVGHRIPMLHKYKKSPIPMLYPFLPFF